MLKKVYYYKIQDIEDSYIPFQKMNMTNFLKWLFGIEPEGNLNDYQVPSDLSSNASIYNELISLVFGRYYKFAIIKIEKNFYENDPKQEEVEEKFYEFATKFLSLLNETCEYYITLLTNYNSAKASLMADIKATSKNNVKFNDTPQNPNTAQVYEGDDYITHFTHTEGETSSPLMSKMMRLKEIQDNYRDLMSEWLKDFERIFYAEEL